MSVSVDKQNIFDGQKENAALFTLRKENFAKSPRENGHGNIIWTSWAAKQTTDLVQANHAFWMGLLSL
jgi:hypothetical protein